MTPPPRVFVVGTGMTTFGKGRALREMVAACTSDALADAGMGGDAVERVYFGNAAAGVMTGQEMVRAQAILRGSALEGVAAINVENACASGSSAFMLAWEGVASGRLATAVAVGSEQLWHEDRARTFAALQGATDVSDHEPETDTGHSVFMDVYASEARRYMEEHGATLDDLAGVAVKNRRHAAENPRAQYRSPQSVEDVLRARVVSEPLTLAMCSPTSDGAAALVLCSEEVAARLDRTAVEVRAVALAPGHGEGSRPVADAAAAAYEMAGLGPQDLDVVELHDAAAPAELIQYGEIGLCAEGEGHHLVRRGDTAIGGRTPTNTSGGLMSRGHPLGATGCAQLVELAEQLRGRAGARQVDGARVGLAVNGGGWIAGSYAVAVATVLGRWAA